MPEITITISGPPGVGKSTLAQLIADRLRVHRVAVEVLDQDVEAVNQSMRAQQDRVDDLTRSGVQVTVRSQTTRRRT